MTSTKLATDTYAIVRARLANGLRIGDGDIVQLCDEIERLRAQVETLQEESLSLNQQAWLADEEAKLS